MLGRLKRCFPKVAYLPVPPPLEKTELTLTVSGNESSTGQWEAGLKEGVGKRMDDEEDDNR